MWVLAVIVIPEHGLTVFICPRETKGSAVWAGTIQRMHVQKTTH